MKRKSDKDIMSASKPRDIFTMNADTLEQEKEEYLEQFKPEAYGTIKNFLVTQKVILLYREALSELSGKNINHSDLELTVANPYGKTYKFLCNYVYDIKIGKMYVTENNIVFVIDKKYKKYYENYIEKTGQIPKLNKETWGKVQYMFPKVSECFKSKEGSFIIIVNKPCPIYPVKEILKYFGNKIKPEYVASILTRLYYFEVYLEVSGFMHNGITIDNLFFAPGRTVKEGAKFDIHDMRIVGVYGGWFYSTESSEKIIGVPKEVYEIMPAECKKSCYSSYKVDLLSIKRLARKLLGDSTGSNLEGIPKAFAEWVTNFSTEKNAYEELCAWEEVRNRSFGKPRFVEMDVSIN